MSFKVVSLVSQFKLASTCNTYLPTLSKSAKLNIQADHLAKTTYRKEGRFQSSELVDHQDDQGISIELNWRRLNSKYDPGIRFHVDGYHLRTYLQAKRKWSDTTWDLVDFPLFELHLWRLRPARQMAHMKFVRDQQPWAFGGFNNRKSKMKRCHCVHAVLQGRKTKSTWCAAIRIRVV